MVSVVKRDTNSGNIPRAAIKCNFTIIDGFTYDIYLEQDAVIVSGEYNMSPNDAASFAAFLGDLAGNDGSVLDHAYSCCVTAKNATHILGPSCSLPGRPVSIGTTAYASRSSGGELYAEISFPFTCGNDTDCSLHVIYYDEDERDNYCKDAQVIFEGTTCGTVVSDIAQESLVMDDENVGTVTTRVALAYNAGKRKLKSQFSLRMALRAYGASAEPFWNVDFTDPVTLHVVEDTIFHSGVACYIENDPYVYTFDGAILYLEPVNSYQYYTVLRHTNLPVEIQVKIQTCGGWRGACSCGVMIRAGTSTFVADYCGSSSSSITLLTGDKIKWETKPPNKKHKLTLPHNMVVELGLVPRSIVPFKMLNMKILATPSDVGLVEGLCGNLNGYWPDDVPGSDYFFWWRPPTTFISGYAVTSDADRIDSPTVTLVDYEANDENCVCFTSTDGTLEEPTCSVKESDTCTSTIETSNTPSLGALASRKRRSLRKATHHINADVDLLRAINEESYHRSKMLSREKRLDEPFIYRVKRDLSNIDQSVIDACNSNMDANCGELMNNSFVEVNVNVSFRVNNCIGDSVTVSELSAEWARIACDNVLDNVISAVELAQEVMSSTEVVSLSGLMCPQNCNDNGVCNINTCICNSGFGLDGCTLDITVAPIIQGITGDGECDLQTRLCNYIALVMNNVADGALCYFYHYKITVTAEVIPFEETIVVGIVISMFDIYCPVPTSNSRRRHSTSTSSGGNYIAEYYNVSVSNDGSAYSTSSSVVVFDSTCVSYDAATNTVTLDPQYCIIDNLCHGNFSTQHGANCTYCNTTNDQFDWSVYDGYCYMGGVCYADGETNGYNGCSYCDSTLQSTSWTTDTASANCSPSEDDEGLAVYIIVIIVLATLLAVAGIVAALVLIKKHLAKRSLRTNRIHGLYDHQMKQKFHLRPDDGKKIWAVKVDTPRVNEWVKESGSVATPTKLYTDRQMMSPPDVSTSQQSTSSNPNSQTRLTKE
ncbi:hypothetical protein ACF0H5_008418 [Mactra antiquata]